MVEGDEKYILSYSFGIGFFVGTFLSEVLDENSGYQTLLLCY